MAMRLACASIGVSEHCSVDVSRTTLNSTVLVDLFGWSHMKDETILSRITVFASPLH